MAKVTHLQCDVSDVADSTVRSISLPLPIVSTDNDGNVDMTNGVTYQIVTLKLDVADKVIADVLLAINKAASPLFTENTSVSVKGERKARTESDSDATDEPVVGSPSHMRDWARKNGFSVNERGALPKPIKDAYAKRDTTGE